MKLINKRKRVSLTDIEERKEAEVEVKRRRRKSARKKKDDKDRISDLPDYVLLHIMEFMNPKQAVQTCVLSKRWKDLWKRIASITLDYYVYNRFKRINMFDRFVSRFLSCRDSSVPMLSLSFARCGFTGKTLMNRIIKYAASHSVRQLTIYVTVCLKKKFELPPSIFCCRSLTYLELTVQSKFIAVPGSENLDLGVKVPKTFELPELKTLILQCLDFSTSDDNSCAEPFSKCNKLSTLIINNCFLDGDGNVLYITNPNLSRLTIGMTANFFYEVVLTTPKLRSFTTEGLCVYELSSACELPFLNEVSIDVSSFYDLPKKASGLISWLNVLSNVKTLTLSASTIEILNDVPHPGSIRSPPPCFVRWTKLKVTKSRYSKKVISEEELSSVAQYLHQNSPLAKVEIIRC